MDLETKDKCTYRNAAKETFVHAFIEYPDACNLMETGRILAKKISKEQSQDRIFRKKYWGK